MLLEDGKVTNAHNDTQRQRGRQEGGGNAGSSGTGAQKTAHCASLQGDFIGGLLFLLSLLLWGFLLSLFLFDFGMKMLIY